jgi:hypothetical protein
MAPTTPYIVVRSRFTNARSLKAYAGSAPVTRASGKSLTVTHRKVKNQRLAAVGYVWAFVALTASPGVRAHYDRRKNTGDRHTAAQRNLFNRLLGCLHHCLQTLQHYCATSTSYSPPPTTTQPRRQLDKLTAWDVFIASEACAVRSPWTVPDLVDTRL